MSPLDLIIAEMHPQIRVMAVELKELHDATMIALQAGHYRRAEDLDARYADLYDRAEAVIAQMGEGHHARAGIEPEPYGSREEADLLREFSVLYYHYDQSIPFQGTLLDLRDLAHLLRGFAEEYSFWLGRLDERVTDAQLIEVAREAYEARIELRGRR